MFWDWRLYSQLSEVGSFFHVFFFQRWDRLKWNMLWCKVMSFGNRLAKYVGFGFLIAFNKASLADHNALFASDSLLPQANSLHWSNTLWMGISLPVSIWESWCICNKLYYTVCACALYLYILIFIYIYVYKYMCIVHIYNVYVYIICMYYTHYM